MNFVYSRLISGGQYCGNKVASAIRHGALKPATDFKCSDCAKPAIEYDHRDYNKPLEVDPVCRSCNLRRGKAIPKLWEEAALLAMLRRYCDDGVVPWAKEFCLRYIEWKCANVETATRGKITRHDLRSDLYPEPETAA